MERTFSSNLPNTIAMYIYSIDMVISGLIMLLLTNRYHHAKNHKRGYLSLLFLIAGAGFIIAGLSPDDTRHTYHVIGSALFVAMFWIIATNYLFIVRRYIGQRKFYMMQLILQVPVFAYAITYFLDIDAQSTIQKFAFAALIIVLLYVLKIDQDN